jgi:hypothetical protein
MSEELMKRPHYGDEFVRRRAAELALPVIKRWIGAPESSDADLMRDLMRGLTMAGGYECAKEFENLGWNVNSQLVEILEDGDFLEDARDELVKQWVRCLHVELTIPIGAAVSYRGIAGKVVGCDPSMALYHVRTPDMKENQWMVCAAEEVKAAASAVAA